MSYSMEELWNLQEDLLDDPRLPDILRIIDSFPKPKSKSIRTSEEHLISVLWGFHMEQEALIALRSKGYAADLIDAEHHDTLSSMPRELTRLNDIVVNGVEYDIKSWHSLESYAFPKYVSDKPTLDVVPWDGRWEIHFTGVRTMANAKEKAMESHYVKFVPMHPGCLDYMERMKRKLGELKIKS